MSGRARLRSVGGMNEAENLGKRYGERTAVNRPTCTARPGKVTVFLGPGAGKPTPLRGPLSVKVRRRGAAVAPTATPEKPTRTTDATADAVGRPAPRPSLLLTGCTALPQRRAPRASRHRRDA